MVEDLNPEKGVLGWGWWSGGVVEWWSGEWGVEVEGGVTPLAHSLRRKRKEGALTNRLGRGMHTPDNTYPALLRTITFSLGEPCFYGELGRDIHLVGRVYPISVLGAAMLRKSVVMVHGSWLVVGGWF